MTRNVDRGNAMTRLEELSLSSWPALKTVYYDGWIVRVARRVTNRSNSVWPLYPSTLNFDAKITACESLYANQDQPAVFRIALIDDPPPLDDSLNRRRYAVVTPTSVQTMSLASVPSEMDSDIMVETRLSDDWFEQTCRLLATAADKKDTYRMILESIALPCCFAAIRREGRAVTMAIAVCQQDWVGLYGMITEPAYRGRGLGRKMLTGLLRWGMSLGAGMAYLHVEEDNTLAAGLYERIGFRELYRYWYRVQPASGGV